LDEYAPSPIQRSTAVSCEEVWPRPVGKKKAGRRGSWPGQG
jgi:hypothetical protein